MHQAICGKNHVSETTGKRNVSAFEGSEPIFADRDVRVAATGHGLIE
jgi:hypothetical protein